MKSSLIILIFFLLGCVGGLFYTADFDLHILSIDVLYLLMLLLGINLVKISKALSGSSASKCYWYP